MKIGVYINDVTPTAGGASSLLRTIKDNILSSDSTDIFYLIYRGDADVPYRLEKDGFIYVNIKSTQRPFHSPDTNQFNLLADNESLDLFWLTFPCILNLKIPYIYTVWDLGHRSAPFFPEVSRTGWLWDDRENCYQKMLYKASYILTGCETGKKEILENYPMKSNKIRIAEFPVASFCFGKELKPSFYIDYDYFFYPAQFWPHKNHIRIVQALRVLQSKYNIKPHVVFTGSDKGNKEYIIDSVKKYNLDSQVFFAGFVSDEELKYLYTHAVAMIFASLLGPNNMPPIEATYLGCPVIITDLDGHKEQLQDTALYFNGCDPESLATCMYTMLTDVKTKEKLSGRQKILAKKFENINYFESVQKIIDEYRSYRETWGRDYIHL